MGDIDLTLVGRVGVCGMECLCVHAWSCFFLCFGWGWGTYVRIEIYVRIRTYTYIRTYIDIRM